MARALEGIAPAASWERLVPLGTLPGLALGAERRLRRSPGKRTGNQKPPVT
jgi:hypothetical protein